MLLTNINVNVSKMLEELRQCIAGAIELLHIIVSNTKDQIDVGVSIKKQLIENIIDTGYFLCKSENMEKASYYFKIAADTIELSPTSLSSTSKNNPAVMKESNEQKELQKLRVTANLNLCYTLNEIRL